MTEFLSISVITFIVTFTVFVAFAAWCVLDEGKR